MKSIVSLGCLAERANARFCTCIALSMRAAAHLLLLVGAAAEETFHLHHTRVVVSKSLNSIRVYRDAAIVFETLPNDSFLRVGRGSLDVNATIYNGALYREPKLGDNVSAPNSNVVDRVVGPSAVGAGPATVAIYGSVGTETARVAYRFALTSAPGELNLRWACEAAVGDDPRSFLGVRVASPAAEEVYGFGMTYSRWNLKNLTFPVITSEQGVGRGLEPVTTAINAFGGEQGGDWHTTYSACSSYVTSLGRGLVVDSTRVGVVDLGAAGGAALELSYFGATALEGTILVAADAAGPRRLLAVVAALSNVTGRMAPLPAWVDRGAIVGTEGGSAFVDDVVANLTAFDVPLAGIWLQDWTGLVNYTEGQRVLWNWELSETWYPDWRRQTRRWRETLGARVLAYANPYFTNVSHLPHRRDYYAEGVDRGYFVKTRGGAPYVVRSGSIEFCMVDLTNPAAKRWMTGVVRDNLVGEAGAAGWMHDFGEYVPLDAALHDGSDPVEYHSRYALDWADVGRAAAGGDGDLLWFDRSATSRSPGAARLMWMGDQLHTLDEKDGLHSAVVALLQSGLSGFSLGHSDVGGYTTVDVPLARFPRSAAVLMRWAESSAFSDAVFRTHPGSLPRENVQVYSDAAVGAGVPRRRYGFGTFARVAGRRALPPLRGHFSMPRAVPPVAHGRGGAPRASARAAPAPPRRGRRRRARRRRRVPPRRRAARRAGLLGIGERDARRLPPRGRRLGPPLDRRGRRLLAGPDARVGRARALRRAPRLRPPRRAPLRALPGVRRAPPRRAAARRISGFGGSWDRPAVLPSSLRRHRRTGPGASRPAGPRRRRPRAPRRRARRARARA